MNSLKSFPRDGVELELLLTPQANTNRLECSQLQQRRAGPEEPETQASTVSEFVANSLAENTRRAYVSDVDQFLAWGGSVPSPPTALATYLAAHAAKLSIATLSRRLASISKAHELRNLPNPCKTELVRATLRGIKRSYGRPQEGARPLLVQELLIVLDAMDESLRAIRDRALLLLGFAGAFRRSELIALDWTDIARAREGLVIRLRQSKTDHERIGRRLGIPKARSRHCPVKALDALLAISGSGAGPIFRRITRTGRFLPERLSGDAVSLILKRRLSLCGIDPAGFSGHSLRAGFVTSAAQANIPIAKIRDQTGHTSDDMVERYIRPSDLFTNNAAGALL
jgi:integrase